MKPRKIKKEAPRELYELRNEKGRRYSYMQRRVCEPMRRRVSLVTDTEEKKRAHRTETRFVLCTYIHVYDDTRRMIARQLAY